MVTQCFLWGTNWIFLALQVGRVSNLRQSSHQRGRPTSTSPQLYDGNKEKRSLAQMGAWHQDRLADCTRKNVLHGHSTECSKCSEVVVTASQMFQLINMQKLPYGRVTAQAVNAGFTSWRLGFDLRSGHVGFVVERHWDMFPPSTSVSPANSHSTSCFTHYLPLDAGTIGPTVVDVPSGLSLTPPYE
jgi:hypothetical protein